jgi:L-lysine exporter family protein LysE/ArgO
LISAIAVKGFSITFSLILAIGAQNAFILKQGLKKEFIFTVVALCIFFDTLLISSGVFGIGFLVSKNPFLIEVIAVIGILFLVVYGLISLKSAYKGQHLELDSKKTQTSLKKTVSLLLVFTLLNPHAYLDTILLIGGVGANYTTTADKLLFLSGCLSASSVWFILLGYGSRALIPFFKKDITWRILDTIIAIIMFLIAYSLLDLLDPSLSPL